jgi:hypothetical protein
MIANVQGWLEDWAPAAEWGVALSTVLLALVTVSLARRAREQMGHLREQASQAASERQARAMLDFVGHCANASALYQAAFRPLRQVLASNADPTAVADAERALDRAEERRQAAYAQLFHVEAEFGSDAPAFEAARAFMTAVDRQRATGRQVIAWSGNPERVSHPSGWPNVRRIREPTGDYRRACIEYARALLPR